VSKRLLVVAHDRPLGSSRVALLVDAGYRVKSVASDDEAMALLEQERFDLILLGRKSLIPKIGLDQRLRGEVP
jgi:DNA-binding response OmpR family regulator